MNQELLTLPTSPSYEATDTAMIKFTFAFPVASFSANALVVPPRCSLKL